MKIKNLDRWSDDDYYPKKTKNQTYKTSQK